MISIESSDRKQTAHSGLCWNSLQQLRCNFSHKGMHCSPELGQECIGHKFQTYCCDGHVAYEHNTIRSRESWGVAVGKLLQQLAFHPVASPAFLHPETVHLHSSWTAHQPQPLCWLLLLLLHRELPTSVVEAVWLATSQHCASFYHSNHGFPGGLALSKGFCYSMACSLVPGSRESTMWSQGQQNPKQPGQLLSFSCPKEDSNPRHLRAVPAELPGQLNLQHYIYYNTKTKRKVGY